MNKLRIAVVVVIMAVIAALLGVGSMSQANADAGTPGDSADNPIVVSSLDEIPAEAALSAVLNDDCSTTTTGVLTVPGNEDTTHEEFRYLREVPGVDEVTHQEYKIARDYPAVEETSHLERKYKKSVEDFTTQYHFRKYTQTRERTYTKGSEHVDHWWNWSPNHQQGPFAGPPAFPTDSRGTWQGPHTNGGPSQSTYGTFQQGGGNSSWFHREHISDAVAGGWGPWGPFGPWTAWVPETHTSWENSTAPLGSPAPHGSGQDGNVQWERVWQAQFDGQTRQVSAGTHDEFSEWTTDVLGEPWVLVDERKVVDTEAQPGYTVYYVLGGDPVLNIEDASWILASQGLGAPWYNVDERTVVDSLAVEGYTEYYVLGGEPSTNEEDASWILAEQAPEGWTQFDQRTVSNEDGTPEVVTYYSFNDGVECEKPEEPPVDNPPPVKNPPVKHDEPNVPVLIDAGL